MINTISYDTPYKAIPMSRVDIRNIAEKLKEKLQIPINQPYIDVTQVLERLCDEDSKFSFEIVEDDVLEEGVQAESDVQHHTIYIKKSVYDGAAMNNGRDRITIAHEIFHILLHQQNTLVLFRRDAETRKIYENPEWQAECFAGEFLMPYNFIKDLSIQEIMENCKVTESAAYYQTSHI